MTAFEPPFMWLVWLWSLWLAQGLWGWYNVGMHRARIKRGAGRERRGRKKPEWSGHEHNQPEAIVVVAVKGADGRLHRHLASMLGQAYRSYRLVYAVESESDGAAAVIRTVAAGLAAGRCKGVELVVAGRAEGEGQKVHNLLAALERIGDCGGETAIVFADADTVPGNKWLATLVRPLSRRRVAATTGYRWLVPVEESAGGVSWASRIASVLNASVATAQGPRWRAHAWGGSMAILRKTMDEIDLVGHWRGALSDDYQLTRAVRGAGRRLRGIASLLVDSPVSHTWGSLWRFGRRQYQITRVYAPGLWWMALGVTWLYTAGWVSAAAAGLGQWSGWGYGLCAWGAVWVADLGRARQRRLLVREVLGAEVEGRLSGVWRLERWGTAVWMAVHGLIVASSAVGRTVRWAGIVYRVRGRQDVRVVGRE